MRRIVTFVLAAALVTASLGRAAATESHSPGFPVTIENCGRTYTFDEPPNRVVTGYYPVFETLVALGLGDQVIGRMNFQEAATAGFLPGHEEVYDATPEISPTNTMPTKEQLLALEPDFVMDTGTYNFEPSRGQATIEELVDSGAPVYITGGWCDAEGIRNARIADIFDDIRNLGLIFGVPDAAAELAAEYQALLDDVEQRVTGLEPVDVLATAGGEGPVNAYGGSGFVNQMIELAGGRNVLADIDEDYAEVSVERIATSNPEAMLVSEGLPPPAEEKADTVFALIPDSPAARDRRFLPVPGAALHSGSRNILAIPEIAAFLHPEAFEDGET